MIEESQDRTPKGKQSSAVSRRARYKGLFDDCWGGVRAAVENKLPSAIAESLMPLAKSLEEPDGRRLKMVLSRDRAFVQAYLEALQPELTSSISAFVSGRGSESGAAKKLSLVGHEDSEFDAAVDQSAARLRNACDEEFGAVKLRLINLLREPDLRDAESPFRVALFVRAIAGALRQIGIGEGDIVALMRIVSGALGRVAGQAYMQIDQRLAASGAGDAIPAWQPTGAGGPGAARTSAGGAGGPGAASGGGRGDTGDQTQSRGGGLGGLDDAQTRSALVALLQARTPTAIGPAGVDPAALGAAAVLGPAVAAAMAAGPAFDPGLMSAVNEALRASAAAAVAGRAEAVSTAALRHGLIGAASRKLDKLTIELIGLLFDRIARDRHVPDAIKEQLARLQFPLLKVALADPELFADPQQPARRLLDRIASTSVGWSAEGDDNKRYFDQVCGAIDTVINAGADAPQSFAQALEKFETFLEEERTRDDDPIERARRALAEAENREILAIKATMQVRSAFDGVQLESYLRDFLLDVWVRVLVDASAREKNEPGLVRRYLDVIPELVWSVQPKINPGDRKRMIGTIPGVLAALREGLEAIEWPAERIQQFFGRLMNSHASAVKALELAHGSLPQFTPATVRIKLDGFRIPTEANDTSDVPAEQIKVSDDAVRHALHASAAPVTHLEAPPKTAMTVGAKYGMDEPQSLNVIAGMRRGLWFDMRTSEGKSQRVVLRWISPKKSLYLFTTTAGDQALSVSPDTLTSYLQSGWLMPVESAPLFDRVVQGVMSDLKTP
ncbi:MAG: DUF1631 family protein [Burkholderiaceae bacterium]|nr:DUF1631 family protein [Burkholderiaceae bacterium]